MTYDLNQFSTDSESKISTDNDTGVFTIPNNKIVQTLWEMFKTLVRYKTTCLVFLSASFIAFLAVTGDFNKSMGDADEVSKAAANDDYAGLFDFFVRKTDHTSPLINSHPFYQTKGARKLEAAYEVEFGTKINLKKLFAYAKYKDRDWIVMKSSATGKDRKKLVLEYHSIMNMDAEDYCAKYFDGYVPDDEMINHFVGKYNIWKIKNEVSEDNDGPGEFRCVIDPDTIIDYIENDRED